jgi:hypothetical protein
MFIGPDLYEGQTWRCRACWSPSPRGSFEDEDRDGDNIDEDGSHTRDLQALWCYPVTYHNRR